MIPRPYQTEAREAVLRELATRASTLVAMPTGTGKAFLAADIAHRWQQGRVLIQAHREELIFQMARTVEAVTGEPPAIEMAEYRSDEAGMFNPPKVVVGSVQTLCRPKRLGKFSPVDFGLVITDEAHHDVPQCSTYKAIRDHFSQSKWVGVTATPDRSDRLAMGQSFESVAYELSLPDAIDGGWLVPIRQQFVKVDGLDFSHVGTVAGDLNQGQLDEVMGEDRQCHAVAAAVHEISAGRKTLVFCVSVQHAKDVCAILNRIPGMEAAVLTGDDDRDTRRKTLERFRNGLIRVLVGCAIFTEGFDEPSIEVVFIARPTKSRSLFTQMVGRGTRPLTGILKPEHNDKESAVRLQAIAESAKPWVEIIDFVGNSGKHKLVTCADLLAGRYAPAAVQRAIDNQKAGGKSTDVSAEIKAAQAELEREEAERKRKEAEARQKAEAEARRKEAERKAGLYARAELYKQDVDSFGGEGPVVATPGGFGAGKPLTPKQRDLLRKQGYDPNRMTPEDGRAILSQLFDSWKNAGLTPKQKSILQRFGESGNVSRERASALLSILKARGWQKRDYKLTRDRLSIRRLQTGQFAPMVKDSKVGTILIDNKIFGTLEACRAFLANVVEA